MANEKTTLVVIGLRSFPNNDPIQEILLAKYLPRFDIYVVILQQDENEQREKFSPAKKTQSSIRWQHPEPYDETLQIIR